MICRPNTMCAHKGFDAVELDDIDSYDPPSTTGFQLTPGAWQNFLAYTDNAVHRAGMAVLWKNSPLLAWWGRRYADGAVVEACYAFGPCFSAGAAGASSVRASTAQLKRTLPGRAPTGSPAPASTGCGRAAGTPSRAGASGWGRTSTARTAWSARPA